MSDLYYLNARIRAMWGRLLTRNDYEKILAAPGLPEIAASLRETPYGFFIESVGRGISDAGRMEEALRRNFQETLSRLLSMSGGDCREAVRLLLGSWEVQAVKTVLRGRAAGLPPEEILASLLPTGLHGEAALQELCRQPSLRAVVDLLATWRDPWGVPLSRAMREYREQKDLFVLEAALDRFRAGQAAAVLREIRRPHRGDETDDALSLFLALSVDRANLMTALKAVEEKMAPANRRAFFLPGGRIYAAKDFDGMLSSRTVSDALAVSARSFFSRALAAIPASFAGIPLLTAVERRLDRVLQRVMRARMRSDPLGWGMPASFLLNKTREIQNLRMIFRARMAGMPDADLMELLILEY
jgi:V/A-type H+-transporting ATPase subunit C